MSIAFTVRFNNNCMIIIKYDRTKKITDLAISYINAECYQCVLELFDNTSSFNIDINKKILMHCDKAYELLLIDEPRDFAIFKAEYSIRSLLPNYPFHTKYSEYLHEIIYKYTLMDKPHAPIEIQNDYLVKYPIETEKIINMVNKAQEELYKSTHTSYKCKFDLDDFMKSLQPYALDPFPYRPGSKSKLVDRLAFSKIKSSSISRSISTTISDGSAQPLLPIIQQKTQIELQPLLLAPIQNALLESPQSLSLYQPHRSNHREQTPKALLHRQSLNQCPANMQV